MEHYQKFVSSRGILRSCDLFNSSPQSGSTDIAFGAGAQLPPGGSVYCCTDALLRKSLAEIGARRFNFAKLYLAYWRRAIRGAAPDLVPALSMLQYHAGY